MGSDSDGTVSLFGVELLKCGLAPLRLAAALGAVARAGSEMASPSNPLALPSTVKDLLFEKPVLWRVAPAEDGATGSCSAREERRYFNKIILRLSVWSLATPKW
jgi:hypothetical protein